MVTVILQMGNMSMDEAALDTLTRNIQFFCNVPLGSLPQMRGYGISYDFLGESISTARRKLTVGITDGLRRFFSLHIKRIAIEPDADGGFIAKIKI